MSDLEFTDVNINVTLEGNNIVLDFEKQKLSLSESETAQLIRVLQDRLQTLYAKEWYDFEPQ